MLINSCSHEIKEKIIVAYLHNHMNLRPQSEISGRYPTRIVSKSRNLKLSPHDAIQRAKMSEASKIKKSLGLYLTIIWMTLNILLSILMIASGDYMDLNNWIETLLFAASVAGLWLNRKWGLALAVSALCITLGTSMGNVLLGYYLNYGLAAFVIANTLRIIINAVAVTYLFKLIFAHKFN